MGRLPLLLILGLLVSVRPLEAGFAVAVNYGAGITPNSVAVGDFNLDGEQDLAFANGTPNDNVSILLGNANGTFQAAVNYGAGRIRVS